VLSVDKARKGAGFGLKTTDALRRGDIVVEYLGERITEAERLKRPPTRYTVWLEGKKTCIDAEKSGSLARFANHACTQHPNM
jgi:SET domain-containing protein